MLRLFTIGYIGQILLRIAYIYMDEFHISTDEIILTTFI